MKKTYTAQIVVQLKAMSAEKAKEQIRKLLRREYLEKISEIEFL